MSVLSLIERDPGVLASLVISALLLVDHQLFDHLTAKPQMPFGRKLV